MYQKYGRIVLSTIYLLLTNVALSNAVGDHLSVVVDISGSMATYGSWQGSARNTLKNIMAGKSPSSDWIITPPTANLRIYAISSLDKISLIKFGNVPSGASFPFFDKVSKNLSYSFFETGFSLESTEFKDARTNKSLAEAVGATLALDTSGSALVMMISDFLADSNPSDAELQFINEVQSKYVKYTDATLSWAGHPRIQIKLLRFTQIKSTNLDTSNDMGTLRLLIPRYDENKSTLLLSWNYEGKFSPQKYDLQISDARKGSVIFTRFGLAGKNASYSNCPAGLLKWSVKAYASDGTTIEQSSVFNVPESKSGAGALVLLFTIILLLLGTASLAIKKYGLPELPAFLKRNKTDDETI